MNEQWYHQVKQSIDEVYYFVDQNTLTIKYVLCLGNT